MTMLLLPGFMLDEDLWRDVRPGLEPFEPLAFGDLSRGESVAEMARLVLAEAPRRFVLVGFSMGGYVAREIVRQAPERVSALVLVATSARGDNEIQARRKASIAAEGQPVAFRGLTAAAIASSLHPDNAGRADLIGRIQAMGQRLGADTFRRQSLLVREDGRADLRDILCPTLVIAGSDDRLRSREELLEIHEGIAGSAFAVIEGTGHMLPLEAPDRLAEVIGAWLGTIGASND